MCLKTIPHCFFLNNKTICDLVNEGQGAVSYRFKWSYKKNSHLISPPPLPLLEKEEVHLSFIILKFDVFFFSMLSVIFKAWVHPLKVHSESRPFCKETPTLVSFC